MTRQEALREGIARLQAVGVDEARRDARYLLAQVVEGGEVGLISGPEKQLRAQEEALFTCYLDRRAAGEPCSRILEKREFWSMQFRVTADVLDPRPESEILIQAVLDALPYGNGPLQILDLGTGSGCLLLALLSECASAGGLGIDLSKGAVTIANENAEALGLAARANFLCHDWREELEVLKGNWDIIVSNPPYIERAAIPNLMREVRDFDPRVALDGGEDGLDAYRQIAALAGKLLKPEGLLALEFGMGQARPVGDLLKCHGLNLLGVWRDLSGLERVILANSPKKLPPG